MTNENEKKEGKGKVKGFFKKHSELFTNLGIGIALMGSFVLGEHYDNWCVARGMKKWHEDGLMKLFDESGNELGIDKFVESVKNKLQKK